MAGVDDYIQLPTDSTGKKVRGWYNTVGANVVYAQAFVPTDVDANVLANSTGLYVGGHLAHDAVDAGNPIKIGGYATNGVTSAVSADGDRVNAWFDRYGKQVSGPYAGTNGADAVSNTVMAWVLAAGQPGSSAYIPLNANMVYNGSSWDRMRGDTSGLYVGGNVANDVPDAGNPVKIGGRAATSTPTAVNADGDRVNAMFDTYGRLAIAGSTAVSSDSWAQNVGIKAFNSTSLAFDGTLAVGPWSFNGSAWDRNRSIEALSTAPNVKTGIQAVGIGPGFDIKLNPANLGTAVNSAITNTVDGARSMMYYIGTSTTGTFAFEVTADDSTWVTAYATRVAYSGGALGPDDNTYASGITPLAGDVFEVSVAGYRQVRIRTATTLGATVAVKTTAAATGGVQRVQEYVWSSGSTLKKRVDPSLLGDASNIYGATPAGLWGYNGATWDRVRTANTGRLQVDVITGGGGGTQYVEDVAFAGNGTGTLMVARRDDSLSTLTPVQDDAVGLRVDSQGALWSRSIIQLAGATPSATGQSMPPGLGEGAGSSTSLGINSPIWLYNGTTWDAAKGDTTNGLWVNVKSATLGDVTTIGKAATDAAVSGNPVYIASRASDAVPTAVGADGRVVPPWLLRTGAQVVAHIPHDALDGAPYTLISKTVQTTSTQTGSDVWSPASGKKICITSYQIQAGGTTAGTMQLWFGANADTTYTRGTDYAIFDGEFAPSATLKPGVVQTGTWISPTADYEVHLTTSAAINPLTITLWGYEF